MKSDKSTITKILIEQLPADYFNTQSTDDIIFKIWTTGRSGNGLGLTDKGFDAFTQASFKHYDYVITDLLKKNNKNFIRLSWIIDKKIKCPYYINLKQLPERHAYIRIYDSRIAMMINLYGSFAEYIELTHV